ncbi:hypothetical protein F0Q45_20585 [Mycobacterium simiae]|uniref:Uncharacterized protein n=1 Tax=Mycobacterium simiae TaxID=1784 RepID=A0A5B1BN65_MYCSI|nr:DUF5994 family protein [Mycobacterium simiae]KAA1248429.1 hypothetical protein F0Q45_20585 [Mycobacterium simiae]
MQRLTRLQLKSFRPALEHVAGPGDRGGGVGGDDTPPVLEIGGQSVELPGFRSDEPASVMLIGQDGHHLTLHVVAPDASDQSGQQPLDEARGSADCDGTSASRSLIARSVADVAYKLAQHEGRGDERRTTQIRPWCEEAAQQFIDAPVQTFVPILVEHFVRNPMMQTRVRSALPASS